MEVVNPGQEPGHDRTPHVSRRGAAVTPDHSKPATEREAATERAKLSDVGGFLRLTYKKR